MQMWFNGRSWRPMISGLILAAALVAFASAGCKKQSESKTLPSGQPAAIKVAASQPITTTTAPATQPSTQPTSQPASKPASRPVSTFSSKPPYPVDLYVISPKEKQPGWLRIQSFFDDNSSATCSGSFPEHNVIEVQTNNVSELRLHIGYLPLAPRKRIVLRIDSQPIELARKNRMYVVFERRTTGEWRILRSED